MKSEDIIKRVEKDQGFYIVEKDEHVVVICTNDLNGNRVEWCEIDKDFFIEAGVSRCHPVVWEGLPTEVSTLTFSLNLNDYREAGNG